MSGADQLSAAEAAAERLRADLAEAAAGTAAARDALAAAEAAVAAQTANAEALSEQLAAAEARAAAQQEALMRAEAELGVLREQLAAAEAARADVGTRSLLSAQTALLDAEGRLAEQATETVHLQERLVAADANAEAVRALQADLDAAGKRLSEQTAELERLGRKLAAAMAEADSLRRGAEAQEESEQMLRGVLEAVRAQLRAAGSREQAVLGDIAMLAAAMDEAASLLEASVQPPAATDMGGLPPSPVTEPAAATAASVEGGTIQEGETREANTAEDAAATAGRLQTAAHTAAAQVSALRADLRAAEAGRDRVAAAAAGLEPELAHAQSALAGAAASRERERAETEQRLRELKEVNAGLLAALDGCRALLRQSQEEATNSEAACRDLQERLQGAEKRAGKARGIFLKSQFWALCDFQNNDLLCL